MYISMYIKIITNLLQMLGKTVSLFLAGIFKNVPINKHICCKGKVVLIFFPSLISTFTFQLSRFIISRSAETFTDPCGSKQKMTRLLSRDVYPSTTKLVC